MKRLYSYIVSDCHTKVKFFVLIQSYQTMLRMGKRVKLVMVGDRFGREKLMWMDNKNQIIFMEILTGNALA